MRKKYKTILEAWQAHVIKNDGCWGWSGVISNHGYAMLSFGRPQSLAHRFSYELYYGVIPDGMCVCHYCDNRICTNPKHLFLGTVDDNIQDMIKKGRNVLYAKLTVDDVIKIREMITQGINNRIIAKEFNVVHQTISAIKTGQTWKHIQ